MSEWQVSPLGELCGIELGRTPARKSPRFWDVGKTSNNVWLSIADLPKSGKPVVTDSKEYISDEGAANGKMVREGTLLVSFKLTLGRLAFAGRDLFTNEAIAALTIFDESRLSKDYLYWYLTFFDWNKAAEGNEKIKGKTLNKAKLKELSIFVLPLPEQKRIVAILDEAFAGITQAVANTEKNLANARELFDSSLQSVFKEQGDGWMEKTLEDSVDRDCSLSYGIVQPGHEYPDGLPVVRPTDLATKVIEVDGLKRIDPSLANSYRRTTLRGGDLLLCVRGSTGVVSVASTELAGANVTRGIVPIVFNPTLVSQDFAYYLIRSETVQSQIREKTYGAALMQINIRDMRVLLLPLPPLKEQEALAVTFEQLQSETQRLESIYTQKLSALTKLKQSILQKAFAGELSAEPTELKALA